MTNLTAGNYSVLVTDVNGCTTTNTITLTQPAALTNTVVAATYNGQNISCNGLSDGSINLTVAGGTTAYTYSWSNAQVTQDISGLNANTYSVLVTDVNGCTTTNTITLTQPAALTTTVVAATYNGQNISCNGLSDGSINLTVAGGTTAYTYQWSNLATTQDISGLSAGPYSVLVTDMNGCTATHTITLTQPVVLTTTVVAATYNGQNISCNGLNDGSINLLVSGGTTAYSYLWSNAQVTQDISGLNANTYSVLVTDVNGCTATNTITLTQPATLTTTISVSSNYNGQNISCNGLSDGAIDLTVSGGTTNYTYSWSNSAITQDISGLNANTYSVLVTDVNGCTATNTITLIEPAALTTTVVAATYNGQNISCNGLSDGAIDLTVSGGTTNYTYSWSNAAITQDISGLNANTYSVLVTDVNGCTTTNIITLIQPAALTTTVVAATYNGQNISCNGLSDGSIDLSVAGGTTAYTYQWSNLETTQDVSGLNAGPYSVLVTDVNGCSATHTITLTQPAILTTSISVSSNYNGQNISCNGLSDGAIDLSVSGGTANYTYAWSNAGTTQDISGLNANTYSVLVTDVNGCTITNTITITQPAALSTTIAVSSNFNGQNISCNGASNGAIDLSVSGGTTNYTYSWSNAASTQDLNGLNANTYSVLVTDVNGCTATNTITVTDPPVLASVVVITSNVNCNGGNNGSANINPTGGTPPYTYFWSNGQTTSAATGLAASMYNVTVTDVNGCSTLNGFVITQPSALTASVTNTNVSCNGGNNGITAVTAAGGTVPFSYLWTNGQTASNATGLSQGTYSVTTTDGNGCTRTDMATITQPTTLSETVSVTNVLCNGGNTGTATVNAGGGTSPYTYLWSAGGQTAATATGLSLGTYTVTVTDNNGCVVNNVAVINQPAQLTDAITNIDVLCNGGNTGTATVVTAGGMGSYSYQWNNGQTNATAIGLSLGTYSVTITDANGCSISGSVGVTQPAALSSSITVTDVLCNGGNTGTASVLISGGMVPYTYSWSNGNTTAASTGMAAGIYFVTATDSNGCSILDTAIVNQPLVLSNAISTTNVLCNGDSSGTASISVSGGMVPYNYLWTNGVTTSSVSGLIAGNYSVTVTDSNGCYITVPISVTQPALLSHVMSSTGASCNGGNTGTAAVSVIGGVTSYTYLWSNANNQSASTATGLTVGNYFVSVRDSNGCSFSDSVHVSENSPVTLAFNTLNVSCYASANGQIDLSVSGGVLPYSYTWSTGDTIEDLSGLANGTYTITVLDGNQCSKTDSVVISRPDSLHMDISTYTFSTGYNINPFGGTNGSITLAVEGGTHPYEFFWTNGSTEQNLEGLTAGSYTVQVVDSSGCIYITSITLTEPFEFAMPGGISPNGDGKNDVFVIHGLDIYTNNKLQIFNRWGDEVYSVADYKNDWGGTNKNGDKLPDGTYFVILKVNDGEKTLTGYVDIRK
jgi:gliding motility-associated-like protein